MFHLAQAGGGLWVLHPTTGATFARLKVPSGVVVSEDRRMRVGILGDFAVIAHAPTVNLLLNPLNLQCVPLAIEPPTTIPTLAEGAGTGLTGAYEVAYCFGMKDQDGRVMNLSPLSRRSASVTVDNKDLTVSGIEVSPHEGVNFRRLFRTAADGSILFDWIDIDDNVTTSFTGSQADELLGSLPADPALGNPLGGTTPGTFLKLLVAWKSRLWGVSTLRDYRDGVFYTEIDALWAWPADNFFPSHPKGADKFGVTGLIPRRDELGMAKRGRLLKIIGEGDDDFRVVIVHEEIGCIAPDSIVVIHDVGYFLGLDGVYRWDDQGVECITRGDVDPWFTTSDYFDRERFEEAIAHWNPKTNSYELGLWPIGDTGLRKWVSFELDTQKWLGPHITAAFLPTCHGLLRDPGAALRPVIGGDDGYVYLENGATKSDTPGGGGAASSIHWKVTPRLHHGPPKTTQLFLRLAVQTRIEALTSNLTVTPYVGSVNNPTATPAMTFDLTKGHQIGRHVGVGRACKLVFEHNTAARDILFYGYDLPQHEVGVREPLVP